MILWWTDLPCRKALEPMQVWRREE
uniref:Uncharacterized protein n=1 Tax=Arundo donax TaxID=35708 RepID=A0A0A9C7G3_ARUDO